MSTLEHRPVVVLADRPIVVARECFVLRSDGLYELVGVAGVAGVDGVAGATGPQGEMGPPGAAGSVVRVERVVPRQSTVQSGHGRDGPLPPPSARPSKTASPVDPRKGPVKVVVRYNPKTDGRIVGPKSTYQVPQGWASHR